MVDRLAVRLNVHTAISEAQALDAATEEMPDDGMAGLVIRLCK